MAYQAEEQASQRSLHSDFSLTKTGLGQASAPPPTPGAPPPYTPQDASPLYHSGRGSLPDTRRPHALNQPSLSLDILPAPSAPQGNLATYPSPVPQLQRQVSDPQQFSPQTQQQFSPPQQQFFPPQQQFSPPQQQFFPPQQGYGTAYQQPPYQQYYRAPQFAPQAYRAPYAPRVSKPAPRYVSPSKPTGYNVVDLFKTGNHLQLVPVSGTGKPLKIDWGKLTGSGGYGDQTSMFEVVVSQEPGATQFTLRNVEKNKFISLIEKNSLLSLSEKVQIKLKTVSDADCGFKARPVGNVESSIVCLESAAHPGYYLGIYPNGNTTISTEPAAKQAQFKIRATKLVHKPNPSRPLQAYGRTSQLQNVYDRCPVQLCNKASRKYLGIDRKGAIIQTEDRSDEHILFMVYDRGMGVVSLRSWKHAGYWLRTTIGGVLTTKGNPVGLDGDYQLKESYDGSICFTPLNFPNMMMAPPGSDSCYFTLSTVDVDNL